MRSVFDTNIIIDHVKGIAPATESLDVSTEPFISRITWIEVLVGARNAHEDAVLRQTMDRFSIYELIPAVAERAARVRRETRLKLPDALIYATAQHLGAKLVTRNTRDFPPDDPIVHVPYQLPTPRPD